MKKIQLTPDKKCEENPRCRIFCTYRWRTHQKSLFSLFSLSFSPRALRRSPQRLRTLCSSVFFSLCSFPSLPFRVFVPTRYVDTVAGDCAPRSLSVVPSCWTRPSRSLTVPLLGSVPSRCRARSLRGFCRFKLCLAVLVGLLPQLTTGALFHFC